MRPRAGARRRREIGLAYLLLTPALLLLGGVLAYPLGWEIWTSFTSLSPLQDGVRDPVRLALNPERLRFFDTKTQLSI